MSFFTQIETHTARLPHRCTSCGELVEVGSVYKRWMSFMDGDVGTNKMHPECLQMHQDESSETGEWEYSYHGYERPPMGVGA